MKTYTFILLIFVTLIVSCAKRSANQSRQQPTDTVVAKPQKQEPKKYSDPLLEADTSLTEKYNFTVNLIQGDLFRIDTITNDTVQLTHSNQTIKKILISPNGKYVVYTKFIRLVNEPGEWTKGEQIPKIALNETAVINLITKKRLFSNKETSTFTLIGGYKWISNSRLCLSTNDTFAECEPYVYDAFRDTLQRAPYGYDR